MRKRFAKFAHGMGFYGADDKIDRLIILDHAPLSINIIFGKAPITA